MKRFRIVLDTNVILSAVLCGGNPAEYFALANAGVITLFTSSFILEEVERVLTKKFRWKSDECRRILDWYGSMAVLVKPEMRVAVVRRKDSDNRILECAMKAEADYLVTGDRKDLLPIQSFQGIRILSPIEGLSLIRS